MCGIFCYIYCEDGCGIPTNTDYNTHQWRSLERNIANRGPDSSLKQSCQLNGKWHGRFIASVLWMQGLEVIHQPFIDDDGNILLWNGDIFDGPLANNETCDTVTLSARLKSSENIFGTINEIEGPFSIIYFHKSSQLLYFARDRIGRHSLLIRKNYKNQSLTICSVANKNIENTIEVPAVGVFVADLQNYNVSLSCHLWQKLDEQLETILNKFERSLQQDIIINESIAPTPRCEIALEPQADELVFLENILEPTNFEETMCSLLKNAEVNERVTKLLDILKTSIKTRCETMPQFCKNCIKEVIGNKMKINCIHSKIGILFSGGLDSTILAAIANDFIPKDENIDLINVAFEKATSSYSDKTQSKEPAFDVPDRITGRQALEELQKICPNRIWNFIEVNVPRDELQLCCAGRISDLIYPLRTILDESLGCAVWFASRGSGFISSSNTFHESSSRVLLLGMGADELFGGYARHRTLLRRNGWAAVSEELKTELSRISERNLGRDDRMVADHGRQARLPYLDEKVIQYVRSLKPWERCYPTEKFPPGLGDKLLLRLVAYKIGLHNTANFPKRAFQFGSRIANSKQRANDLSECLQ